MESPASVNDFTGHELLQGLHLPSKQVHWTFDNSQRTFDNRRDAVHQVCHFQTEEWVPFHRTLTAGISSPRVNRYGNESNRRTTRSLPRSPGDDDSPDSPPCAPARLCP